VTAICADETAKLTCANGTVIVIRFFEAAARAGLPDYYPQKYQNWEIFTERKDFFGNFMIKLE
jgi:hypothetical protein